MRSLPGSEMLETNTPLRPAWVQIDLAALTANLERIRQRVAPAGVMAAVKADAYGHGAVQVSRVLQQARVDWLGVAMAEEGAELRRAGVTLPILVMGSSGGDQLSLCLEHRLVPAISSSRQLSGWCDWARHATETRDVHLKIDTGMGRLGFAPQELAAELGRLRACPRLRLAGLFSHLAAADELDNPSADEQQARLEELQTLLTAEERRHAVIHLANSAAALHRPTTRGDLVRVGLALYGLDPARVEKHLEPVMSVHARIAQVRHVPVGGGVSYNWRWRAARPSRIGALPLGYGDGYPWALTNRGDVLVAGRRVPVVGAVCMDTILIDLTDTSAKEGDEVTLLGSGDGDSVTAWELAERAATIPYEIFTSFGLRLPRLYVAGERVKQIYSRHLPAS